MNEVIERPTAIAKVNGAISSIKQIEAQIAELAQLYGGAYDVTTPEGMRIAKNARKAVREPRLEIERIRIEAKRDLLAVGRGLDSVAASLTEKIEAIEKPIAKVIDAEEARIEAERQALIDAELKRVEALRGRIDAIRRLPVIAVNKPASEVQLIIDGLNGEAITEAVFAEFYEAAVNARVASLASLHETHAARVKHEVEAEQLRLQRIENERLQAEANERARLERERLALIDAEEKAVRDRIAAAQAAALAKDRADFEATKKAESDRIAAERAQLDRALQAQRDAEAAAALAAAAKKASRRKRPTEAEILDVLAVHFRAEPDAVRGWLAAIDWKSQVAA